MNQSRVCKHVWWPKTWWDAFKHRWFPEWALRRWPMETEELRVQELYTNIAVPREGDVRFVVERYDGDNNAWRLIVDS